MMALAALKWNGNHRQAYWRGHDARCKGSTQFACPYDDVLSKGYKNAWLDGWYAADAELCGKGLKALPAADGDS